MWEDRWRPEFSSAYFGCLTDPVTPCSSAGAESCFNTAATAIARRQSDGDYFTACMQKRTDCPGAFIDDYCSSIFLSDAWLAQAQACLAKPCTEVGACIHAIFKP
jgi:hypothetical protein